VLAGRFICTLMSATPFFTIWFAMTFLPERTDSGVLTPVCGWRVI
jgi:hypothetical protein